MKITQQAVAAKAGMTLDGHDPSITEGLQTEAEHKAVRDGV